MLIIFTLTTFSRNIVRLFRYFVVILQMEHTKPMNRLIAYIFISLMCIMPHAVDAKNDQSVRAKQLFEKIYNNVFGPQGSTLSYKVNIIGLYKTEGTIVYKGKKLHYREKRYMAWEDGVTAYMVDKKKQEVNIYDYDDDRKDAYLSKFKYDVNNFDFSYTTEGDYYLVTAKVKNASFFGIKWVMAKVRRSDLSPVSMTIKLAFIRTTVEISNFRSGKISDNTFRFPKDQFKTYKFTDYRGTHK